MNYLKCMLKFECSPIIRQAYVISHQLEEQEEDDLIDLFKERLSEQLWHPKIVPGLKTIEKVTEVTSVSIMDHHDWAVDAADNDHWTYLEMH